MNAPQPGRPGTNPAQQLAQQQRRRPQTSKERAGVNQFFMASGG